MAKLSFSPIDGDPSPFNSQGDSGGAPSFQILNTLTPSQQRINGALTGAVQQGLGLGGTSNVQSAMNNALMAHPETMLSPDATASYINQSVATPLLRQYDQSIMPRINDSFAAVGALMGSRRAFANQQALENLQATIGQQLGQAQLSNQQLSANLAEQTAQRQGQLVGQQQQAALNYGQLGAALTGQSQMAIQPFRNQNFGNLFNTAGGGLRKTSFTNPANGVQTKSISDYISQLFGNDQQQQPDASWNWSTDPLEDNTGYGDFPNDKLGNLA